MYTIQDGNPMIPKQQHGGRRPGAGRPRKSETTKAVRLPLALADLARAFAPVKRLGDIAGFLDIDRRSASCVPMMEWAAVCGFPSPAEDYVDGPLDFNELLIEPCNLSFRVKRLAI
jgi:DNA polymerase V